MSKWSGAPPIIAPRIDAPPVDPLSRLPIKLQPGASGDRIDGWDADPEEEKKPENVIPRIEKVVGGRPFKLDWVSVYSFNCRRIDRFVHDRVIFVGDSAHVVSPFGARGGNGGMHDVDNLCWKLARVVRGESDE